MLVEIERDRRVAFSANVVACLLVRQENCSYIYSITSVKTLSFHSFYNLVIGPIVLNIILANDTLYC